MQRPGPGPGASWRPSPVRADRDQAPDEGRPGQRGAGAHAEEGASFARLMAGPPRPSPPSCRNASRTSAVAEALAAAGAGCG
jgi:hypothetical protein